MARVDVCPLLGGVPTLGQEVVHGLAPLAIHGQGHRHVFVRGLSLPGNGAHWSWAMPPLPHLPAGVGLPRAARLREEMGGSPMGSVAFPGKRRCSTKDCMGPPGGTSQPAWVAAVLGSVLSRAGPWSFYQGEKPRSSGQHGVATWRKAGPRTPCACGICSLQCGRGTGGPLRGQMMGRAEQDVPLRVPGLRFCLPRFSPAASWRREFGSSVLV